MAIHEVERKKKILRDLIHGYINLEEIDLFIIDTPYFQRLKDIRQLTCQHVYPSARHTRFEHSLGVLELTRQAIKYIKSNGYLSSNTEVPIDDNMERDTALAALLHDVGHCPFSHLGERQFEGDDFPENSKESPMGELREELVRKLKHYRKNKGDDFDEEEFNVLIDSIRKHKTAHELLSCIVILDKYIRIIRSKWKDISQKIDFEFIVRCVLGISYKNTTVLNVPVMNILIGLINSKVLDMDKLDYIMRDSFCTGISVPNIDTKRLFKSMFISKQNKLVYKSKAVPVLQTIIETRDNLYLWVYNHHAVVYTDFLYHYILRRLHHNARDPKVNENVPGPARKKGGNKKDFSKRLDPIKGILDRKMLFSSEAISQYLISDSTLRYYLTYSYLALDADYHLIRTITENDAYKVKALKRVYFLLDQLFRRILLKSWWKTLFEYENFMHNKISDDKIRRDLARRVCSDSDADGINAAEFRSQIAKGVIELSKILYRKNRLERFLCDGDFFIVERSNRFYTLNLIEEIMVYLKKNTISGFDLTSEMPEENHNQEDEYFGKYLYKLLPQKDYENFFNKDSFYIYINPEPYNIGHNGKRLKEMSPETKKSFYDKIEYIFIAVSSCLASMSAAEFKNYCGQFKKFEAANQENDLPEVLKKLEGDISSKFPMLHTGKSEEKK
jgi:HD superfamily phosphohydrolase